MIYQSGEKLKPNKDGRPRTKAAFTLLEMLTSISLIVIITALFIANYKSSNKRTDLTMTAQKMVADIHAAQNNTLGLVKYGNEVPAGGWGLHFVVNANQYVLFADLNRPASNEPGQVWPAAVGYMDYDPDSEGLVDLGAREVDLPKGIAIDSIQTCDTGTCSYLGANVTFLPPDPQTNIWYGYGTSTMLRINLLDKNTGTRKTVRVNFLGLAEVID